MDETGEGMADAAVMAIGNLIESPSAEGGEMQRSNTSTGHGPGPSKALPGNDGRHCRRCNPADNPSSPLLSSRD